MMDLNKLKSVMKFQLMNFNDEQVQIDDNTIHKDVLNESDGIGNVNSVSIYKDVIRHTLKMQGHTLRNWPAHWLELSVDDLASQII